MAMIRAMNRITEEPDWQQHVFNEDFMRMQRSRCEALISDQTWQWCIAELQDKASIFEKTGLILAVDAGYRVCKSPDRLAEELRTAMIEGVRALRDMSPVTSEAVATEAQNIIDPSLYPFIYERTPVLPEGEVVSFEHPCASCGKGHAISAPILDRIAASDHGSYHHSDQNAWSKRFQWLPCEVQFTEDHGTAVRITSYINNLNPKHHADLYKTIETLIAESINAFNQVLVRERQLSRPPRIRTYGYDYEPNPPAFAASLDKVTGEMDDRFQEAFAMTRRYLDIPDDRSIDSDDSLTPEMEDISGCTTGSQLKVRVIRKWKRLRCAAHPEPGISFTYEDWQAGRTSKAIVEKRDYWGNGKVLTPDPDHEYHELKLQDEFRQRGLQVIVRMSSIDLSPTKSRYPGEDWCVDGTPNEHIVATAVYCYDQHNITDAAMTFRQSASMDLMKYRYNGVEALDELSEVFDIPPNHDMEDTVPDHQVLGTVSSPQGRLLTWPNTIHTRLQPFELIDKSESGHRRCIILSLVDPHYRILSTQNVPPQQHGWWFEEAANIIGELPDKKLPRELIDRIDHFASDWPMGTQEAQEVRREFMAERAATQPWHCGVINFIDYWM